ncbi:hypothetical protein OAG01_01330 [bacterium]|nr:hypothetical protein [bacterium]
MKNAGMAGAVALVGIGLLSIGLSNFANRAEAVPSAVVNAGPDEPVIVDFGSLGLGLGNSSSDTSSEGGFYRLWSDGRIEVRKIRFDDTASVTLCGSGLVESFNISSCGSGFVDTGWLELPPPPGGDGFACRTDINGDRTVNAADLGLLIAQWGEGVSCDPQPTYPCFDLGNLSIAAAK